jgi:hypothetical protein
MKLNVYRPDPVGMSLGGGIGSGAQLCVVKYSNADMIKTMTINITRKFI